MSPRVFTGAALVLVVGALVLFLQNRVPRSSDADDVQTLAAQVHDEAGMGEPQTLPSGLSSPSEDEVRAKVLARLHVVGDGGGLPLIEVPNYSGVGLDRVNVRAWLASYGAKELGQGEGDYRLGLMYESGVFVRERDLGAALQYYQRAAEARHTEAARRATLLLRAGITPSWPRD